MFGKTVNQRDRLFGENVLSDTTQWPIKIHYCRNEPNEMHKLRMLN